jgi:hypothetical protein
MHEMHRLKVRGELEWIPALPPEVLARLAAMRDKENAEEDGDPRLDIPDGYALVEGDNRNLLLIETGDLVDRFDLWVEGYLDYEDLSESQKVRARRLLETE